MNKIILAILIFCMFLTIPISDIVKARATNIETFDGITIPINTRLPLSYNNFIETFQRNNHYASTNGIAVDTQSYFDGSTNGLWWETPNGQPVKDYDAQVNFSYGDEIVSIEYDGTITYDGGSGGIHAFYLTCNTSAGALWQIELSSTYNAPNVFTRAKDLYTGKYFWYNNRTYSMYGTRFHFKYTFLGGVTNIYIAEKYGSVINSTSYNIDHQDTGDFHHFFYREKVVPTSNFFKNVIMDNLIVDYGESETYDIEGEAFCFTNWQISQTFQEKIIEFNYINPLYTGYLTGFEIWVGKVFYNTYATGLNNFTLTVNGVNFSHPNDVFDFGNPDYLKLRWYGFAYDINSYGMRFELYSTVDYTYKWALPLVPYDVWGMTYGDDFTKYGDDYNNQATRINYYPAHCFYLDGMDQEYNFTISQNFDGCAFNGEYNSFTITANPSTIFYYRVENSSGGYISHSWGNANPTLIRDVWVDESLGTGTFYLKVVDANTWWESGFSSAYSFEFCVVAGNSTGLWIEVTKPFWNIGESLDFHWRANYGDAIEFILLNEAEDIYHFNYTGLGKPNLFLNFYQLISDGWYEIKVHNATQYASDQFFVGVEYSYNTYALNVDPDYIYLGDVVFFSGWHGFEVDNPTDLSIQIYKGSELQDEIYLMTTEPSSFWLAYQPKEVGDYWAYLCKYGEPVQEDYKVTFEVVDEIEILPPLDPITGAIVGSFVVLAFTLAPIMIIGSFEKIHFKIDIPPVVYVLFAGTGVILSTIAGFWGWYVPFFVIAIGVVVIFLMYFTGYSTKGD